MVMALLAACKNDKQEKKGYFATKLANIFGGGSSGDSAIVAPLTLHYKVGAKMYYTISSEDETTVETSAKTVKNSSKTTIGLVYEVVKDSANQYLLKLTFDKLHFSKKKEDVEQDLDADNGKVSIDPTERVLGGMKGTSLWVTMTSKGKVLKVDGYKSMSDSLLNATGIAANSQEVALFQTQMEKLVGEEFMKSILEQGAGLFPDKAINEGETWNRKETQTISGLKVNASTTYKLKSIDDGIITMVSETDIDNQATDLQTMGYSVNTSLQGNEDSKFQIESATGFLVNSRQESTLKGTIQMMGQEIPIKIKSIKEVATRKM